MRSYSIKGKSQFVFKRGLWLILLSLTVVAFVWGFDPSFHFLALDVIWVIGICMVLFAVILYLPFRAILFFGLITVSFHNLLDTINVEDGKAQTILWDLFHREDLVNISNHFSIFIVYPLMPWIGVMSLGYCLGKLYSPNIDAVKRKKILLLIYSRSIMKKLFADVIFMLANTTAIAGCQQKLLSKIIAGMQSKQIHSLFI